MNKRPNINDIAQFETYSVGKKYGWCSLIYVVSESFHGSDVGQTWFRMQSFDPSERCYDVKEQDIINVWRK